MSKIIIFGLGRGQKYIEKMSNLFIKRKNFRK